MARNRAAAALLAVVTAAALAQAPSPVGAQAPSTNPVSRPVETVNLTMEQRHVIKEIILKDFKIEPLTANMPTKIGGVVPAGIPLQPMPVEVAAKVPQLKTHSFFVKDDTVVIVDPKDNTISAVVE